MPKFSANLGFLWPDRPLLDRITSAADAGFKAVELHWPYDVPAEEVRDLCASRGLTLLGINTPMGGQPGDSGLGALEGRQDEFAAAFDQAVAYSRAAGGNSVHVMAGIVAAELKLRARAVFVENLQWATARAPDLTLLLEPINQRDKPGFFYSTIEEAASISEDVGAANLKIMFDVYHVGVSQGDVLTRLDRFFPQIGHIQIAAVPSRAEPDEGEIAYAAVFDAIDRLGYTGWVGAEYKPRGDMDEGLRWLDTLGVKL